MVTPETIALIDAAKESFIAGGSPFTGPVTNQDGEIVWKDGVTPTYADIETMDFLVQGVVGSTG
jgi:simple sugar transport system substrate-binding protein/basic membrane protein A